MLLSSQRHFPKRLRRQKKIKKEEEEGYSNFEHHYCTQLYTEWLICQRIHHKSHHIHDCLLEWYTPYVRWGLIGDCETVFFFFFGQNPKGKEKVISRFKKLPPPPSLPRRVGGYFPRSWWESFIFCSLNRCSDLWVWWGLETGLVGSMRVFLIDWCTVVIEMKIITGGSMGPFIVGLWNAPVKGTYPPEMLTSEWLHPQTHLS